VGWRRQNPSTGDTSITPSEESRACLPLDAPRVPDEEQVLDVAGEGLWQLAARGILALDLQSTPWRIRLHDLATGATSVVLELPAATAWEFPTSGGAFTVSPDERWALIATLQIVESDIMLLDGFR
jgi:hypothetical protein